MISFNDIYPSIASFSIDVTEEGISIFSKDEQVKKKKELPQVKVTEDGIVIWTKEELCDKEKSQNFVTKKGILTALWNKLIIHLL